MQGYWLGYNWKGATVLKTCRPLPEGKESISWVTVEDVMGRSHYAPAVKNGILRGWGLIRLGRGVPMVIAMVTDSLSQEMAAGEVELIWVRELKHGRSLREEKFDGLS